MLSFMQWRSFPITAHSLYRPGWLVSAIYEEEEEVINSKSIENTWLEGLCFVHHI